MRYSYEVIWTENDTVNILN